MKYYYELFNRIISVILHCSGLFLPRLISSYLHPGNSLSLALFTICVNLSNKWLVIIIYGIYIVVIIIIITVFNPLVYGFNLLEGVFNEYTNRNIVDL